MIPGVEAEFAVTVNEEWQIDGSVAWNDAKIDKATTLTLTDSGGTDFSFTVSDGARLPLTPDWSATLGLEYRASAASLLNARPFARFDLAYVGKSVNSLEGIESVVSGNPVRRAACVPDRRPAIRPRGRELEQIDFREQCLGRTGRPVPEQSLGDSSDNR